jgi:hypothetical protein
MSGQHNRPPFRDLRNIVDEFNTKLTKAIYNYLVVNNLVIAVDRRLERSHHPDKCFDSHFHPRAKTSRGSQKNLVYVHVFEVSVLRGRERRRSVRRWRSI